MNFLKVNRIELLPEAGVLTPPGNETLNLPDLPKEPSIVPTSPLAVTTCMWAKLLDCLIGSRLCNATLTNVAVFEREAATAYEKGLITKHTMHTAFCFGPCCNGTQQD